MRSGGRGEVGERGQKLYLREYRHECRHALLLADMFYLVTKRESGPCLRRCVSHEHTRIARAKSVMQSMCTCSTWNGKSAATRAGLHRHVARLLKTVSVVAPTQSL